MAKPSVSEVAKELNRVAGSVLAVRPPHADKLFDALAAFVISFANRRVREELMAAADKINGTRLDAGQELSLDAEDGVLLAVCKLRRLSDEFCDE